MVDDADHLLMHAQAPRISSDKAIRQQWSRDWPGLARA